VQRRRYNVDPLCLHKTWTKIRDVQNSRSIGLDDEINIKIAKTNKLEIGQL